VNARVCEITEVVHRLAPPYALNECGCCRLGNKVAGNGCVRGRVGVELITSVCYIICYKEGCRSL